MMFFTYLYGPLVANLLFLGLFIPALPLSSISTYLKHKENPNYNAVGASGAVSAVVFASIILYPEGRMGLLFIPVMIPSWLFGLLYLVFTAYMDKKQMDNIGHNAHFWGSIYGIVYVLLIPAPSISVTDASLTAAKSVPSNVNLAVAFREIPVLIPPTNVVGALILVLLSVFQRLLIS